MKPNVLIQLEGIIRKLRSNITELNCAHMRSSGSWNPNNCTAITGARDNVVMGKPTKVKYSKVENRTEKEEKLEGRYHEIIDQISDYIGISHNFGRIVYHIFPHACLISRLNDSDSKMRESNQEFLNFGILSSFRISAVDDLEATAQPLNQEKATMIRLYK